VKRWHGKETARLAPARERDELLVRRWRSDALFWRRIGTVLSEQPRVVR
jgi:hypothetical protein